jgi:Spy/CpxP family protein refolding chaperone
MGKPKPPERFSLQPPDKEMFLKKELGLNDEQDKLMQQNRKTMLDSSRVLNELMWRKKTELQIEAFKEKPDTSKVSALVNEISALHSRSEKLMFLHFSELKSILSKEQLEKFKGLLEESRNPRRRPETGDKRFQPPPPPPGEILQMTY